MSNPHDFEAGRKKQANRINFLFFLGSFLFIFPIPLWVYFHAIHFFYYYPLTEIVFVIGWVSSCALGYLAFARGTDLKNLRK